MVSDERELFVKLVCVIMRMRVVAAVVAVIAVIAVGAVGEEHATQNVKKVVDKKSDTRMNRVIHIVIVIVMGYE